MDKSDSLKCVERAAYRSTFEDGIYDIAIGLAFLVFALQSALRAVGVASSYWYFLLLIPALLPWPAKRFVTIPRLGAVAFGPKRKARRWLFLLSAALFLFLTMPLILSMFVSRSHESARGATDVPLIVSFTAPAVLILAAFLLDYARLYIYAAALLVMVPYAMFFGTASEPASGFAIGYCLLGAAILIYGLAFLVRFTKKYPKSAGEDYHDAR